MQSVIDQPCPVRQGEELPLARLADYLKRALPELTGELTITQFPSGHSNLTFMLRLGNTELVLRRPPFGVKIRSAHDMAREFRILAALHPVYGLVPRPLVYCGDKSVIGAPFYVMERMRGVILRSQVTQRLDLSPTRMRTLSEEFVDRLAELHALDYKSAGLGDLGKPVGYAERQVRGWTERYVSAKTDDIPAIDHVAVWLREQVPQESGASLIHNDYKYDNLVLSPFDLSIKGILDWEMATVGDPLMDLGTALGYWVEKGDPEELQKIAFGLTMLPENLTRDQIVERYARITGRDVHNIHFYYIYALFKIAVIVQQIYRRWRDGYSQDPRFGALIGTVRVVGSIAEDRLTK